MGKTLSELKEELKWLEETPLYIGKDGMPSIGLILGIFITGILPGLILMLTYKYFRKKALRKQIKQYKNQVSAV